MSRPNPNGKCEYFRALVDAASLVVHGEVPASAEATEGLAQGVLDLDLEWGATKIDLEQLQVELARARAEIGRLRRFQEER